MHLLADENIHREVVARLRDAGLSVEWLVESDPGATDQSILAREDIGSLILVTSDRDYGGLIFKRKLQLPRAIIYVRIPHRAAAETAKRILAVLSAGAVDGHMITLSPTGDRSNPFALDP